MQRTITSFRKGFANSALALPYITAVLDCGHAATVQMKPARGACMNCGVERISDGQFGNFGTCPCGSVSTKYTWTANVHVDEDRISQIGDVVDCRACAQYAADLAKLKALDAGKIVLARYDDRWNRYNVYRRDVSSPSGKMFEMTIDATPEVETVLSQMRIAAVSPTEGLGAR